MRSALKRFIRDYEYYPTPEKLIKEMLHNVSFYENEEINFLEPCAGDGAIVRAVKDVYDKDVLKINCIELDPTLQNSLKGQGFKVIFDDFESFDSMPFYDLIVMNPPFSKGDKFLLKAYDVLAANGQLICILNSETIKNPHTKERKRLLNLINRVGDYDILENAFSESDRKTDVEIAVVHMKKPVYENEFDIFGNLNTKVLTEEEKIENQLKEKVNSSDLVEFSKLDNAISIYRNCVKQVFEGIETIQKIKDSLIYLSNEAKEFNIESKEFIEDILKNDKDDAKDITTKKIRKMIWSYIIKLCSMDKYLFTKQREEFYSKLESGSSSLPFTKDNINQFFTNLFTMRDEYLKKGIIDLFEEITSFHNGNSYHREGWKTNKNWMINKKIIVDWGMFRFESYRGDGSGKFWYNWGSRDWIEDLDRIVRKIDKVDESHHYTFIKPSLERRFQEIGYVYPGQKFDNEIETPYFILKFYKKGSLHIIFKDERILQELNSIGAKMRNELGYDDYGKTEAKMEV